VPARPAASSEAPSHLDLLPSAESVSPRPARRSSGRRPVQPGLVYRRELVLRTGRAVRYEGSPCPPPHRREGNQAPEVRGEPERTVPAEVSGRLHRRDAGREIQSLSAREWSGDVSRAGLAGR